AGAAAGVWPDGPEPDFEASFSTRNGRLPLWLLLALVLGLYAPVAFSTLVDCWNDPNYSHGVLVPLLALFVARQRHHDVHNFSVRAARNDRRVAWMSFLAGCAGLVLATAAREAFALRTSGVLVLVGMVGIVGGSIAWRRYVPAFALLECAVPLPYVLYYRISVPLQLFSA